VFDAASDKFSSSDKFYQTTATALGANDLMGNTQGADKLESGDLLLQIKNGRAHHTQIITSVGSNGIEIAQGNRIGSHVPLLGEATEGYFRLYAVTHGANSSNPSAKCYIGDAVERAVIDPNGVYRRGGEIIDNYKKLYGGQQRTWSFYSWRR
jgi:hypothetical protein